MQTNLENYFTAYRNLKLTRDEDGVMFSYEIGRAHV